MKSNNNNNHRAFASAARATCQIAAANRKRNRKHGRKFPAGRRHLGEHRARHILVQECISRRRAAYTIGLQTRIYGRRHLGERRARGNC